MIINLNFISRLCTGMCKYTVVGHNYVYSSIIFRSYFEVHEYFYFLLLYTATLLHFRGKCSTLLHLSDSYSYIADDDFTYKSNIKLLKLSLKFCLHVTYLLLYHHIK